MCPGVSVYRARLEVVYRCKAVYKLLKYAGGVKQQIADKGGESAKRGILVGSLSLPTLLLYTRFSICQARAASCSQYLCVNRLLVSQ